MVYNLTLFRQFSTFPHIVARSTFLYSSLEALALGQEQRLYILPIVICKRSRRYSDAPIVACFVLGNRNLLYSVPARKGQKYDAYIRKYRGHFALPCRVRALHCIYATSGSQTCLSPCDWQSRKLGYSKKKTRDFSRRKRCTHPREQCATRQETTHK